MFAAPPAPIPQPAFAMYPDQTRALFTSVGCTASAGKPCELRKLFIPATSALSAPFDGGVAEALMTRACICAHPEKDAARPTMAAMTKNFLNRVARKVELLPDRVGELHTRVRDREHDAPRLAATSSRSRCPPGYRLWRYARPRATNGSLVRTTPASSRPTCLLRTRTLTTSSRAGVHRAKRS